MDPTRSTTLFVCTTAILAAGCTDGPPTLAELETSESLRVEVATRSDVCSCTCGRLICWEFTCDPAAGCSSADEVDLVIVRDAVAGDEDGSQCLDQAEGIEIALLPDGREPIAPARVLAFCDRIEATWRGLPPGVDLASAHRVEIADGSTTWTLADPFTRSALAIVSPAAVASPAEGVPPTVHTGEALVFEVSGAARPVSASASLGPRTGGEDPVELPVTFDDAAIEVQVPPSSSIGLRRLDLSVQTRLVAEACVGPPLCMGLPIGTSFELRVE